MANGKTLQLRAFSHAHPVTPIFHHLHTGPNRAQRKITKTLRAPGHDEPYYKPPLDDNTE